MRIRNGKICISKYVDVQVDDVEVDVYLDINDVKEFIDNCDARDLDDLTSHIQKSPSIECKSLHDKMKMDIIKKIWDNITPYELEEKLKMYL